MASADYSARHLSVLEGLEAVRKRPGMYIGSTDSRGLMHCLWEIIDNSVDEALAGHGSEIEVVLHPVVTISAASDPAKAVAAHDDAHHACFIANSVNFPVRCEPRIVVGRDWGLGTGDS